MHNLNFPEFKFNIKTTKRGHEIFDIVRKKYILLTEEEWVRQHCIHYLINFKNYPLTLLSVEKSLIVNGMNRRTDIVVYGKNDTLPKLIVECKAPHIELNNNVFDQIAQYNLPLKVEYLLVTNGINHYMCKINFDNLSFNFLDEIPDYFKII
jgi:hypothetical protein